MALEENNVASSNGLYGSRSYTQGLYYSWSDRHVLAGHDAVWAGASLYSNTRGSKGSGGGFGWNARLVYLPWLATGPWLHLGMSYSRDRSAAYASGDGNIGYGAPRAGYRTWYGRQSSAARVVHFGAGPAASARTLALELAADQGPVYLQVEGGDAHLAQGGQSAHVRAWSSELAVVITGEARAYAIGKATFGAVRPSHGYGALEVALRYDRIDNFTRASCALSAAAVSTCRVSAWTAGLNYYANPHVRFMFDYQRGLADAGMAGQDRAWGLDARAQVTF
jgi:phosphate-selective porin OprO/OprP